jgi:hypothetical protein
MVDFKPQRIGQMLGLSDNPLYQSFGNNRNAFIQGFAGIGSDPMNPGGGFSRGFATGSLLDTQMAEQQQAQAQEAEQTNMTKEWLRQRGRDDLIPLVDAGQGMFALQEATKVADPGSGLMSVGGSLYDPATGQWISPPADVAANRQNVSLTPQWGQDSQGNWVMLQPSSTGQLVQSEVPEGVTLVDPRQINMERAQGTAIGQAAGQAQVAAPGDIASGEMALDLLNQIRTNPELPYATGTMAGLGANKVPGTGRYGFQNLVDQAKNGAFLSAIQQMRGMGALSNAEGQAATSAITRMDTALSQQDFLKALDDYEQIVIRGVERARQRGGTAPGAPQQPSGGNIDSILQKYGVQ